MDVTAVERIANAVLYEGYLLYPYRPSAVKNQQRFNFGVLYPPRFCHGSDTPQMLTECLVEGPRSARLRVKTRFLQLAEREQRQEGMEREVDFTASITAMACAPLRRWFGFGPVAGALELTAAKVGEDLFRMTLRVSNSSAFDGSQRDQALLHSMVSLHSILQVEGGQFISLLEPSDRHREAAAECRNVGAWPVMAGDPKQRDTMLVSPIILYDYPQIAPESPGDLFDGTEIDEILALRILTMTDEEKEEVRAGDERARQILERTEQLPAEHFQKLHGALRQSAKVPG